MRSSADFRTTVRHGVRVGRTTVVVHADDATDSDLPGTDLPGAGVKVGLVVSKAVGNAVTRNTVKRRLRHLAAGCLVETPAGSRVVLRALPRAAISPDDLRREVPAAWRTALERLKRREGFA
jgi:ribonuclease P protein component